MGDLIQQTCNNANELWATGASIVVAITHLRALIPEAGRNAREWQKITLKVIDLISGNYKHARNKK
jgi:hypothetical protein